MLVISSRTRIKGKRFKREVCEFAECVFYLKPKSKGKDKLESRWGTGIWLGIREESGEIFIGTQKGVIKVRTVRRKGSDEERWNIKKLSEVRGTPWKPNPEVEDQNIYCNVKI